ARQNADTDFRQDAFHQPPRRRGLGRVVVMPSAFLPGSVGGGLTAFLVVLQAAHMPADVLGIDDLRALPLGDSLLPSAQQLVWESAGEFRVFANEVGPHATDFDRFPLPVPFGSTGVVGDRRAGGLKYFIHGVVERAA